MLIGPGGVRIPERLSADILDLGFVSAQDKADAYAGALALCQPSLLESFSLVMMEAWLAGTPALVHGRCAVTRDHCLASNGGLFFEDYFEFVEALDSWPGTARSAGGWARPGAPTSSPTTRGIGSPTTTSPSSAASAPGSR